jgi:methyl-accepting chemotaxis protein
MEGSQESARQSVELTHKTGQSLQLIADKVSEITHMNEQISEATKGQEVSSNAVRNNILHVKQAAEALAKSTTAMLDLSNNASLLSEQVNSVAVQFKV